MKLYLVRLCRSVVAARGGKLTGSWSADARRELGRSIVAADNDDDIEVVPMRALAFRMAELASVHRLSSLGAEAVAASEYLNAPLCVWDGDDGPRIRTAMAAIGGDYLTVNR